MEHRVEQYEAAVGVPPAGFVQPEPDELAPLVEPVLAGEAAALRAFLARVVPLLLRVVRRVLGSTHPDLEDVTYEAAYAALKSLPQFRGEGSLKHFVARVGVLTAMNVRRRDAAQKRPRRAQQVDPEQEQLSSSEQCPEALAQNAALTPLVRELIGTLSEPLAEALTLHVVMGYTVQEIAAASATGAETIRSRLRLAKEALRKRILSDPKLCAALEVEA
ncbi:MAG: sigma-70 family RNA polymerase sigma factor [Polyangiaceae bacterium]